MRFFLSLPALEIQRSVGARSLPIPSATSIPVLAVERCWRWLNAMDSNTAVGAAALLLNSRGTQNTAVGTDALLFNGSGDVSGDFNTATGYSALMNNVTGGSNTAIGWEALTANIDGLSNVALVVFPSQGTPAETTTQSSVVRRSRTA